MAEIALRKSIIVSKYPNQYPACWVHVNDEVKSDSFIAFSFKLTLFFSRMRKLKAQNNNHLILKPLQLSWNTPTN